MNRTDDPIRDFPLVDGSFDPGIGVVEGGGAPSHARTCVWITV